MVKIEKSEKLTFRIKKTIFWRLQSNQFVRKTIFFVGNEASNTVEAKNQHHLEISSKEKIK